MYMFFLIFSNVNDCSGHGFCTRPDQCTCVARFTGAACDACIDRHWGDDCLPCPDCVNGNCNLTNGLCDCDDVNWSGDLCDVCSETFYGRNCEPWMMALYMVANQALDTGTAPEHIYSTFCHVNSHQAKVKPNPCSTAKGTE